MFTLFHSQAALVLLSVLMIAGYVPINQLLKTGKNAQSSLDDKIPLIPIFIYPYLFFYLPWMFIFYLDALRQSLHFVQQVTVATFLSCFIGYFCFVFYPTYVVTQFPKGKGFTFWLLQRVYAFDKQFNAVPSMHVYMVTLFTIFSSILYPGFTLLFVILGTTVTVSTVFTKRHYLIDIVGGLVVGVLCSLIAIRFV